MDEQGSVDLVVANGRCLRETKGGGATAQSMKYPRKTSETFKTNLLLLSAREKGSATVLPTVNIRTNCAREVNGNN